MPYYLSRGDVPHKRHTQFRQPDGSLYREEVFGTKGFSGVESILYHVQPPTAVVRLGGFEPFTLSREEQGPLRHRHFRTAQLNAPGDPIRGRQYLLGNEDVLLAICQAQRSTEVFYKNGEADELWFIHEGRGVLHSMFGDLPFEPGDYVVIPCGTIFLAEVAEPVRYLLIESPHPIEVPRRYRNEYGQMLEHAPFCERDLRVPTYVPPRSESGAFPLVVKARGGYSTLYLEHHPFDVVGWDGYVYPYAFNIEDFEPITGRIHQPPPVHQTFAGHNFVVCSFVPRLFDYHPLSIPAPYNHSNIDSDEVLYYVRGNFMSRRGIEVGSITLHPSGIPHGPHPGTAEASIGKSGTEELAVMMDTFRPLSVLTPALAVEDEDYPYSWASRRG
ncbi:MAG: homogentisate 1,2-dioxygenase [Alicyclobacillus sp.]|nr:homogentisate 1,2-dioxygenase [Alicyclobacillus sp.]